MSIDALDGSQATRFVGALYLESCAREEILCAGSRFIHFRPSIFLDSRLARGLLNTFDPESGLENTGDPDMFNESHATISSVEHLRHDLMIELGRLEMAMEDAGRGSDSEMTTLQNKHERVSAALRKLPLDG